MKNVHTTFTKCCLTLSLTPLTIRYDAILVKNDSLDTVDIDAIIDWDKNGGEWNTSRYVLRRVHKSARFYEDRNYNYLAGSYETSLSSNGKFFKEKS